VDIESKLPYTVCVNYIRIYRDCFTVSKKWI